MHQQLTRTLDCFVRPDGSKTLADVKPQTGPAIVKVKSESDLVRDRRLKAMENAPEPSPELKAFFARMMPRREGE
jgi:hypothetical protein